MESCLGGKDPTGDPVMSVSPLLGHEWSNGKTTQRNEGTSRDNLPSSPLPGLGTGGCHFV